MYNRTSSRIECVLYSSFKIEHAHLIIRQDVLKYDNLSMSMRRRRYAKVLSRSKKKEVPCVTFFLKKKTHHQGTLIKESPQPLGTFMQFCCKIMWIWYFPLFKNIKIGMWTIYLQEVYIYYLTKTYMEWKILKNY